jgi:hemoglobin-like flavoprotein
MALDIELLKESFSKVKPIAENAATFFYQTLFKDHPEAKEFFKKVDMKKQRKALMNGLTFIVDHLEDPDTLTDYLKKMGARHSGYGVTAEHYPIVGETLIKTFQHFFKEEWSPELEAQWIEAYETITSLMLEGAEESEKPQDLREVAQSMVKDMLLSALQEEISEDIINLAREKVNQMILKLMQEEMAKVLSNNHSHSNMHKEAA